MRDLSLHVLDVVENALRAGATVIRVTLALDERARLLTIAVEDNGPGLVVPAEVASDPFYTTKGGKRTGLGLALWREAAERAGGRLTIGRSAALGGAAVEVAMERDHVDRSPLGDLGSTAAVLAATHPEVDLEFRFREGAREWVVRSREAAGGAPPDIRDGLAAAREVGENVKKALKNLTL